MADVSQSGLPVWADTSGLARLARDLRRASPEAWKACRASLQEAAAPVAADAKAAASYSTRIPGSIKVRTGRGNVKVIAGGEAAPNAAPIENKGKGFVRHPTFSPRPGVPGKVGWTAKHSHPAFLSPAFEARKVAAASKIERAVTDAVERVIAGRL